MRITDHLHALRIPFQIPIAPGKTIDRVVYLYLVLGENITLIDSGVAGTADHVFDYIRKQGREPAEIATLILSHSHPDHLGGAQAIRKATGCAVWAHAGERSWIEDTERQSRDRPVPGFQALVEGPVPVDRLLADGEILDLDKHISCTVIHTPGHSSGSISLHFAGEQALTSADSIPLPNDLPIYDDIAECQASIIRLQKIENIDTLLSSWEPPVQGRDNIGKRIAAGLAWLDRIQAAVRSAKAAGDEDRMALCGRVVAALGLPPPAVNPLVAKAFASSLAVDSLARPG